MPNPVTNKFEIDVLINVAEKVVVGDQQFETDHLEFVLLRGRLFEHGAASEKSIPQLQQTPAEMARVCQQSEKAPEIRGFSLARWWRRRHANRNDNSLFFNEINYFVLVVIRNHQSLRNLWKEAKLKAVF